jgi:hypothetical protein
LLSWEAAQQAHQLEKRAGPAQQLELQEVQPLQLAVQERLSQAQQVGLKPQALEPEFLALEPELLALEPEFLAPEPELLKQAQGQPAVRLVEQPPQSVLQPVALPS